MTLSGNKLLIEFDGGGAELRCIGEGNAKVQVRGADFGRMITA